MGNLRQYLWLVLLPIRVYLVRAEISVETETKTAVPAIQTCSEGTYLNGTKCKQCTPCEENEFIARECNGTHNAVCECLPGYYKDSLTNQCTMCTKCAVGWGASPTCTRTRNTVCVACPRGSYSSVESSTEICQSCTHCDRKEQVVLQKCTSKQDTTCFKVTRKISTVQDALTTTVCIGEECSGSKAYDYLYTAPLYCAGLGAVILGLIAYVVFRCRHNKKPSQMTSNGFTQPSSYKIEQQLPAYRDMSFQPPVQPVIYLQDGGKTITVTMATSYAQLPSQVRKNVARSLSIGGSWLDLAHQLGFTPSQISQIQQKAEENDKRSSVGAILMAEWMRRPYSSVGIMLHGLASINRLDLVALIQNSNSMKGSEIV
ncbi:tumor necrosis factor receptor superfamily member 16-like [Watersipora subatra]|uniref:tumor necrosis factor receptor superfamily member 16-like n=1 Tax=Watersipora subatra TaxID=2589382 RepID=UPI00355AF082